MSRKTLAVSLVIPAYNEATYLRSCLEAIAAQTVQFTEVLVVDNNSTDDTAKIARSFPFVTVVDEPEQGIGPARTAGFTAATGDIIARIDADSHLPPNWVETVQTYFVAHPDVTAISSGNRFYDIPFSGLISWLHRIIYFGVQSLVLGGGVLWGSNMAMRRSGWEAVADEPLALNAHEDIDLFVKFRRHHLVVRYVAKLRGEVSLRRGNKNPFKMATYLFGAPRTYWQNGYYLRAGLFGLVLAAVYVLSFPVLVAADLLSKD